MNKIKPSETQAAIDELDRVFHEKARLGILTSIIATDDGLDFTELKEICDLTDGNLNRHLKVLVDGRILKVTKTGRGRSMSSRYRLTAKGRKAFERYLTALETVLLAAQQKESLSRVVKTEKHRGSVLPEVG